MSIRPRVLVVDDIVGSDVDPRAAEYRRTYCDGLGLLDASNLFGPIRPHEPVADALFCAGQKPNGNHRENCLETVELAFRAGWPSEDGRFWSAVLVDMKFGDDERFGLRVITAIHDIAPEVPIIVVSSLNQMEMRVGETLRRAAERLGAQDFLAAPGASGDAEPAYHSTPQNLRRRLDEIGLVPDPDQVVVGTSLTLCQTLLAIRQNIPVDGVGQTLLLGESGSGKSHLAHYVHRQLAVRLGRSISQVVFRPLVLSQKSEDMQKVQLFGTEGASGRKQGPGVFEEAANRGLVFLDELGNLGPTAQGDLLGVLQVQHDADGRAFRSFTRDSPTPRESRCFVLAATNREWSELAKELSEALLMRLEQARITVPRLRERKDDLPLLIDSFLRAACARHNVHIPELDVPRSAWNAYADDHSVRQLHDLIDKTIKTNRFKTLLTSNEFFRGVGGIHGIQQRGPHTEVTPSEQRGVSPTTTAPLASSQSPGRISDFVAGIDNWMPTDDLPPGEFESAFVRLDKAVAQAKLRIWRALAERQLSVNGTLNVLYTVKRLLGNEEIPKSKPGDLANQVFADAEIAERPADGILGEIWDRKRRVTKKS